MTSTYFSYYCQFLVGKPFILDYKNKDDLFDEFVSSVKVITKLNFFLIRRNKQFIDNYFDIQATLVIRGFSIRG